MTISPGTSKPVAWRSWWCYSWLWFLLLWFFWRPWGWRLYWGGGWPCVSCWSRVCQERAVWRTRRTVLQLCVILNGKKTSSSGAARHHHRFLRHGRGALQQDVILQHSSPPSSTDCFFPTDFCSTATHRNFVHNRGRNHSILPSSISNSPFFIFSSETLIIRWIKGKARTNITLWFQFVQGFAGLQVRVPKNPASHNTLYSGDRKRSPALYLLPHVRGPALAWLAVPPYCLLKYPPAVISKWKSRLNLRLHGRSFGSDRYSEYFPLKQDFSVSLPLRLSGRQCLEYIITLASKIPLCAAEKLLRLIHSFIFRRNQ